MGPEHVWAKGDAVRVRDDKLHAYDGKVIGIGESGKTIAVYVTLPAEHPLANLGEKPGCTIHADAESGCGLRGQWVDASGWSVWGKTRASSAKRPRGLNVA